MKTFRKNEILISLTWLYFVLSKSFKTKRKQNIRNKIVKPDFFLKNFAYSDLLYIFAVRKGGAIAHPDDYREVEQWTENLL